MLACMYSKWPINAQCFTFQPGLQALLLILVVSHQKRGFSSNFNTFRFNFFLNWERCNKSCNSTPLYDWLKFAWACAISRCKLHNTVFFLPLFRWWLSWKTFNRLTRGENTKAQQCFHHQRRKLLRCSCNVPYSFNFPLFPSPVASKPPERLCPLSVPLTDIPAVGGCIAIKQPVKKICLPW